MRHVLTVIIPASNEQAYIGACLAALFASTGLSGAQAIVVANGCRDETAKVACDHLDVASKAGWKLEVISLSQGSKPGALNAGDKAARFGTRVYLDADVTVSPGLMAALAACLSRGEPCYASGTPRIPRARSALSRAYARFWQTLPFNRTIAPGYGLFAVNAEGRRRWGDFPSIISDDTFVRLQFQPEERAQVPDCYDWPMIEGFSALTRVRRRQNAGVAELERLYPGLLSREGKPRLTAGDLLGLAIRQPVGFVIYGAVSLAVKSRTAGPGFTRGR
jgi:glycosyltransferase involved in cell wall biosynthesis